MEATFAAARLGTSGDGADGGESKEAMRAVHVLLVGGDPAQAAAVREMLAGDDYTLAVVSRPGEATELAAAELVAGHQVDVVLFNMSSPDGRGFAELEAVQHALPRTAVVVVNSDDREQVAQHALQAGAQDYLLRDHVTGTGLRRALRNAIARQQMSERLAASIEELEQQRASFMQLSQLKNDMIAVLAHDIKGPLTSIVGFAELLEEGFLEGPAATDAARTIRTNAQRLATLANDVLALSRIEHGELEVADERVDLSTIVKNAIDLHAAEREIRFSSDVTEAPVRGDADRLRQVFDNLLRNAIKYSPNGDPVDVTISAQGDRFRVAVRDRGIGIPEDEMTKLFQRFARASNARRAKIAGSGIGLFIVKMIVERHGGSVNVQSSLGNGSTFFVDLPSVDAATDKQPARVTVLTHDAELSQFAAYELRSRGYRVRHMNSLDDLVRANDLRTGEVVVVADPAVTPTDLRKLAPENGSVRLVGIGAPPGSWDAMLDRPFLVSDLLAAVNR
jgi:signal transduction histidine kinase